MGFIGSFLVSFFTNLKNLVWGTRVRLNRYYGSCREIQHITFKLSPMQKVQNTAARLILRAPRHQNCTPLLQQLHWFPISERIKYQTACMCYNAITGSAPSYLSELLHLYSPSRSLRSSSDTRMLKIQRFNRKTHGFRTFSHFGPHIWSNFPEDIRHSATLPSFKSQLKTFLFSEYFS